MENLRGAPLISEAYSFEELASILGLRETEDMITLKNMVIQSMQEGNNPSGYYIAYEKEAYQMIEDDNPDKNEKLYSKRNIAIMIITISMYQAGGDDEGFKEAIENAIECAHMAELNDVIKSIRRLRDKN